MCVCPQRSIEKALEQMGRLGLEPSPRCGVYFGQLLGMADHLTFTLGKHGYKVRKPTSTLLGRPV